jgi:hypothetical protein
VKILKPFEHASLHHEKGLLMENGEFGFDSGEELKVGERLEILILLPLAKIQLRRDRSQIIEHTYHRRN